MMILCRIRIKIAKKNHATKTLQRGQKQGEEKEAGFNLWVVLSYL